MTPWHYDAASETVCDRDTGDAIARDVSREHGALIAAAGEMREAVGNAVDAMGYWAPYLTAFLQSEMDEIKAGYLALLARTEPQP